MPSEYKPKNGLKISTRPGPLVLIEDLTVLIFDRIHRTCANFHELGLEFQMYIQLTAPIRSEEICFALNVMEVVLPKLSKVNLENLNTDLTTATLSFMKVEFTIRRYLGLT